MREYKYKVDDIVRIINTRKSDTKEVGTGIYDEMVELLKLSVEYYNIICKIISVYGDRRYYPVYDYSLLVITEGKLKNEEIRVFENEIELVNQNNIVYRRKCLDNNV